MQIPLPEQLCYSEFQKLLNDYNESSLIVQQEERQFDWELTHWVSLPELIQLLLWSTNIQKAGNEVCWKFPNYLRIPEGIEDLRFFAKQRLNSNYNLVRSRFDAMVRRLVVGDLPRWEYQKDLKKRFGNSLEKYLRMENQLER